MRKNIAKFIFILSALFLFPFSSANAQSADLIRVGIYYGTTSKASVTLNAEGTIAFADDYSSYNSVKAEYNSESGGMSVYNAENVLLAEFSKNEPCVFSSDCGWLGTDSLSYRGQIEITAVSSGLKVINILSLDDYICGVLPNEIYPSWGEEALKAAAVAARSFTAAKVKSTNHSGDGFDVCTTTHCQVYRGMGTEKASTNKAVQDTAGEILKYGNTIVSAVYSANSGGYTEGSENVWYASTPYYVSKPDPYTEPNTWTVTYTSKEVEQKLSRLGKSIGKVQNIRIDETAPSGRATKLTIVGSDGNYTLTKDGIRSFFELKSTLFTITSNGEVVKSLIAAIIEMENSVESGAFKIPSLSGSADVFNFNGKGYGHGVGMSQWGCKNMADMGFNYREILSFYFEGTSIEQL